MTRLEADKTAGMPIYLARSAAFDRTSRPIGVSLRAHIHPSLARRMVGAKARASCYPGHERSARRELKVVGCNIAISQIAIVINIHQGGEGTAKSARGKKLQQQRFWPHFTDFRPVEEGG